MSNYHGWMIDGWAVINLLPILVVTMPLWLGLPLWLFTRWQQTRPARKLAAGRRTAARAARKRLSYQRLALMESVLYGQVQRCLGSDYAPGKIEAEYRRRNLREDMQVIHPGLGAPGDDEWWDAFALPAPALVAAPKVAAPKDARNQPWVVIEAKDARTGWPEDPVDTRIFNVHHWGEVRDPEGCTCGANMGQPHPRHEFAWGCPPADLDK